MKKKKCFKCNKVLSLDNFYKHPMMLDGHLNKCIECAKKDVAKRVDKLIKENPDWIIGERKRGREKYYRLNYRDHKQSYDAKKRSMKKYFEKFPERKKAHLSAQHLEVLPNHEKHHWSYNPEHYKDIIELNNRDHRKLHRYMIYDQERMMFRDLGGILLDTKERHLEYFGQVKEKD